MSLKVNLLFPLVQCEERLVTGELPQVLGGGRPGFMISFAAGHLCPLTFNTLPAPRCEARPEHSF